MKTNQGALSKARNGRMCVGACHIEMDRMQTLRPARDPPQVALLNTGDTCTEVTTKHTNLPADQSLISVHKASLLSFLMSALCAERTDFVPATEREKGQKV